MTAADVIGPLRSRGVAVELLDGRVKLAPRRLVAGWERQWLAANRPEVVAFLAGADVPDAVGSSRLHAPAEARPPVAPETPDAPTAALDPPGVADPPPVAPTPTPLPPARYGAAGLFRVGELGWSHSRGGVYAERVISGEVPFETARRQAEADRRATETMLRNLRVFP